MTTTNLPASTPPESVTPNGGSTCGNSFPPDAHWQLSGFRLAR